MVHIARHEYICLRMITAWEAGAVRQGVPYRWLVRTRPDFLWRAPHPPLRLLQDQEEHEEDEEEEAAGACACGIRRLDHIVGLKPLRDRPKPWSI